MDSNKYKLFKNKEICVYASELAGFIGKSFLPEKRQEKIFDNIYDRFNKIAKPNYPDNRIQLIKKEEIKDCIILDEDENISIDTTKATEKIDCLINSLTENIKDTVNNSDTNDIDTNVKQINYLKEIKKNLEIDIDATIETKWITKGIEKESIRIDNFEKDNDCKIEFRNDVSGKIKFKENNSLIFGKCDGMMNEDTIIETKERKNKLFYELREYEKIQIYAYMVMYKKTKAILIENYKDKQEKYEINYDENYWKEIKDEYFNAIDKFRNEYLLNKFKEVITESEKEIINPNINTKNNETLILYRKCTVCNLDKKLTENYSKMGRGYFKTCNDCKKTRK